MHYYIPSIEFVSPKRFAGCAWSSTVNVVHPKLRITFNFSYRQPTLNPVDTLLIFLIIGPYWENLAAPTTGRPIPYYYLVNTFLKRIHYHIIKSLLFSILGNEVIFSLETASDYVRGDKASAWGFRCSVIGYELQETTNSIRQLETELSYLGGMCAASLMKRDLSLQSNGSFRS